MAKQHYKENISLKERQAFAKYLAEGEELVLVTSLSHAFLRRIGMMGMAFPGGLFMIAFMIFGYMKTHDSVGIGYGLLGGLFVALIIGGIRSFLAYHAHRYLLTTRRVLVKKGFFAVDLSSALYDKITHIEVVQSLFDRLIFHHGKIIINTAGMTKNEIILPFVDYPLEFKNILERLINRERESTGKRGGPVETIEGEIVE